MVFSWPIDRSRFWLSSFFGPRRKKNGTMGFHYGIDMAALKGTSVMAAAPGTVVEARYDAGYGNTIVLAHNGKYKTRYAHLDSIFVKVGQRVQRGSLIGTVGNTGYVRSAFGKDPSHLHFELYMFGKKVNPMHFLV
jgi:murein DD-endopeptidase MepM/ murein hydrolase activator NlpD